MDIYRQELDIVKTILQSGTYQWKNGPGYRRVMQFGYEYLYATPKQKPTPTQKVPPLLIQLYRDAKQKFYMESLYGSHERTSFETQTSKSKSDEKKVSEVYDDVSDEDRLKKAECTESELQSLQIIINEYQKGQGITAHTDNVDHFGDVIMTIRIGSGVTMTFDRLGERESYDHYLLPRSLTVMWGDARYKWRHSINSKTKTDTMLDGLSIDRELSYSITIRTMKKL